MKDVERSDALARVLDEARRAYKALAKSGKLPSDEELARSAAYRRLLRAGTRIRALGSRAQFLEAKTVLFIDDPDLSARAARDLDHLWAGLADWPDARSTRRMN